jgi:hypothetical protein
MKDAHVVDSSLLKWSGFVSPLAIYRALIVWRTQLGSGRQTTNRGSFIGVQWSVIHSRQAQRRDAYQFSIGQS